MKTLERCKRCGGNLYPYEGGMKCLQCSRSFGGKEPEARVVREMPRYSDEFKGRVVARVLRVGSSAWVADQLGLSTKTVQRWKDEKVSPSKQT